MNKPNYGLYYPVKFLDPFSIEGANLTTVVGGNTLVLTPDGDRCILAVEGFSSADAAGAFLDHCWGALASLALERSIPFRAPTVVTPVRYLDEPKPLMPGSDLGPLVHGWIDGNDAHVYEVGKRVAKATANPVTVSKLWPGPRFIDLLHEAFGREGAPKAFQHKRVRLAIELLNGAFIERSQRARLLTYVMILEVLAPEELKAPAALTLLGRWEKELKEAICAVRKDSEDWAALDALKAQLEFRRMTAIRARLRKAMRVYLPGDPDAEKAAIAVNDARGALVHRGELEERELGTAVCVARTLVPRVIEAVIKAECAA